MEATNKTTLVSRLLSPGGSRARLLVFCFHRVLERRDPFRLHEPDIQDFRDDIAIICRHFNVLGLRDAVSRLAEKTLPAGAACITFDDGYADNHALAAPVLEEAGVPATFFVATEAIEEGVMWNDLVIEALSTTGSQARFDLLPDAPGASLINGNPSVLVKNILGSLKYRSAAERYSTAMGFYEESTGQEVPRLMMTRAQVRDLADRGFEIGGHTRSHPILKGLPDDAASDEIVGCADWIQEVTGSSPASFAYPNGIPGTDFTPTHERLVMEAGFECGVSTRWAAARSGNRRYCIPRIGPWWRMGFGVMSGLARIYSSSYVPKSDP
jgi:peptidoglycan/xylan/chitin deacetylase (PgdA/CDA1 family)